MAEYTANGNQTVTPNQAVLFTETPVRGNASIIHREGSGLITLRGTCCGQMRARFRATFDANLAVPTGGTAGAVSLAFALNGEADVNTQMIVTPANPAEFFSVSRTVTIDVPAGCCSQLSIENNSTADVEVANANLIVERIA